MSLAEALSLLNAGLAGLLVGMCALQTNWRYVNRIRNSRILGTAILNIGVLWFSLDNRVDPLRPWVPFVTLGLIVSIYGMKNAVNESSQQLADN